MTRRTLAASVSVEGIGIHTGVHSRVTLSPAPNGAGVVFRSQGVEIPAHADFVVDTSRCTVLGKDSVTVSTVEHLMSAFAGLGITNAIVDIVGPELPIGDGGANIWVDAIRDGAGFREDDAKTSSPSLTETLVISGKNGSFIAAYPADTLLFTVAAVFDHPLIGTQIARFPARSKTFEEDYATEVSPARTFGLIEEVEALRKAGLALGGSEENAVVVYADRYSKPLRFDNELGRHKLLDLMGDLALAGLPLPNMEVFAVKPSHRLNVEFAKRLALTPRPPLSWE